MAVPPGKQIDDRGRYRAMTSQERREAIESELGPTSLQARAERAEVEAILSEMAAMVLDGDDS